MAKKYFIDGVQVNSPINWAEFEMSISREEEQRINLEEFDENLRFDGEAFTILFDILCNGICSTAEIVVYDDCIGIEYEGVIILAECDFAECSVSAKIRNESLFYKLDANKNSEHYMGTTETPNGSTIEAISPVTFFNDDTGEEITMYKLLDVIEHSVAYASDGQLAFQSDFLTTNFPDLYITNGSRLRSGARVGIEITLQNIIDEIFTFFNLWTDIVVVDGQLTYVVEPYESFFSEEKFEPCLKLNGFLGNEELLFARVDINATSDNTPNFPHTYPINEDSRYLGYSGSAYSGWGDLEVNRGNDCTNSTALEFDFSWIRDHNIIQDVIINKEENFDSRIFWINTASANTYPKSSSETPYYNDGLQNKDLINYWSDYLSNLGFSVETFTPIYETYIDTIDGTSPIYEGGDETTDGIPFFASFLTGWAADNSPAIGVGGQPRYFDTTISDIPNSKDLREPYQNTGSSWDDLQNGRSYVTPQCTGYYNLKANVVGTHGIYEFGNVGLSKDAFGTLNWVVREVNSPTSTEVQRLEFFNGQVGFDDGFRALQVDSQLVMRVYLEAGKTYIVDEIEVNLESHSNHSSPVTYGYDPRAGSNLLMFLDEENECLENNSTQSRRAVVASVEGKMEIADWQRIRKNKGLRMCAKNCIAEFEGWIQELTYNSADCYVTGTLVGTLNCNPTKSDLVVVGSEDDCGCLVEVEETDDTWIDLEEDDTKIELEDCGDTTEPVDPFDRDRCVATIDFSGFDEERNTRFFIGSDGDTVFDSAYFPDKTIGATLPPFLEALSDYGIVSFENNILEFQPNVSDDVDLSMQEATTGINDRLALIVFFRNGEMSYLSQNRVGNGELTPVNYITTENC